MLRIFGLLVATGALVTGCAHTPKSEAKRNELQQQAVSVLEEMKAKDPSLQGLLDQSYAYIVFPSVGQGGFIVGGASGAGVLFQGGQATGFVDLSQASIGAQLGGQKFSEVVVIKDPFTLDKMKAGKFDVGGQTSAVMLRTGAAAGTQFNNGVAVVVNPIGGAMLNVSLTGQTLRFKG
jgi:lipid-binding SYLF domain-containing protein